MTDLPPRYRAFLIRCWDDGDAAAHAAGEPQWRFVAVDIADEAPPHGFATLDALMVFLKAQLGLEADVYLDNPCLGGAEVGQ